MRQVGFPLYGPSDQWVTELPNNDTGRLELESEPSDDGWGRSHPVRTTSVGVFRKTHPAWERRNIPNYREILYPPVPGGGGTDINATLATASFATFQAVVDRRRDVVATRPTLTLTTFQAAAQRGTNTNATRATAAFTAPVATVDRSRQISATRPVATFTAPQATVSVSNDTNIAATLGTASFTTYAATVTGGVTVETRTAGAGRSRRRRRYFVEIDGQTFEIDTPQQAADLLAKAAQLAPQVAERQAQDVVQRELRRIRQLGRVPRVTLEPQISTDSPLTAAAQAAQERIRAIYAEAAQRAELQLLLQRAAFEQDEAEIEDMLLMGEL